MNPAAIQADLARLVETFSAVGAPLQALLPILAAVLVAFAIVPAWRGWLGTAVNASAALLVLGQLVLIWFHLRLYELAIVVSPETGAVVGRIAIPLWVESVKLYVWALMLAVMAVLIRRHRAELLPGVAVLLAALMAGAALWGRPFTEPLPIFFGQYLGYLQAMASGDPGVMFGAYQAMEGARQFYYNTIYMWVHPPALFFSYAAFAISFVATIVMIRERRSAYETTSYRWARLGYLPLTAGMLLGFPWAILAWPGESWWWSGKVNMSIMMWLAYTALLHARLYLKRRSMWKWVAGISVAAFVVLLLTYFSTYFVPGAHTV